MSLAGLGVDIGLLDKLLVCWDSSKSLFECSLVEPQKTNLI